MKTPKLAKTARRGAALVVTLSILVLLTALVVSLFLTLTTERTESAAAANQADAQRFAAGVIDLVKATITQATLGYELDASTNRPNTNRPVAWASQPGVIRTWDTDGDHYRSYRLYSSRTLTVTDPTDLVGDANDISNWKAGMPSNRASFNAIWCDLNSPIRSSSGTNGALSYPIVTPPRDLNAGSDVRDPENGIATDNPTTSAQEGVQGFAVKSPPGYNIAGSASPGNNPAPMPVRWLYVLQDGSYVSPEGSATSGTIPGASRDNPIVGRIAYWTDDETAKVNVNTASEGVYWDKPYGLNHEDSGYQGPVVNGFSLSVPVQDEFQRLPGHPAFTSLSAVLGGTGHMPRPEIGYSRSGTSGAAAYSFGSYVNNILPYLRLTPRIGDGGTKGGTLSILNFSEPSNRISLDSDRLYASIEEILYSPVLASAGREVNNANLTPEFISSLSFFLTANSKAPETNVFEQPRIAMWPIQSQKNRQNVKDRLLAFTATLDPTATPEPVNIWHFQRARTWTSNDNPGSSQNATEDVSIKRNTDLLKYLYNSMGRKTPGFGASLQDKYPGGRLPQIIAGAFDTIRSLVNSTSLALPDKVSIKGYSFAPYGPGGPLDNAVGAGMVIPARFTLGGSEVKGFGRFPTISEVIIVFMATDWKDETTLGKASPWTPTPGPDNLPDDVLATTGTYNGVGDPQTTKIRAFVILVPFNPTPGTPDTAPAVRYRIEGLETLSVDGKNLGFPDGSAANAVTRLAVAAMATPEVGIASQLAYGGGFARDAKSAGTSDGVTSSSGFSDTKLRVFPFVSNIVTLSAPANPAKFGLDQSGKYTVQLNTTPSTMSFSGGNLKIKTYAGTGNTFNSEDYVQEIAITLPPGTFPVPQIVRPNFGNSSTDVRVDFNNSQAPATTVTNANFYDSVMSGSTSVPGRDLNTRLGVKGLDDSIPGLPGALVAPNLIRRGDVVRSVRIDPNGPAKGDLRVVAALRHVPASYFAPTPGYSDQTLLQAAAGSGRNNTKLGYRNSIIYGDTPSVNENPHSWIRPSNRDPVEFLGQLVDGPSFNFNGNKPLPNVPKGLLNAELASSVPGDWNTGVGSIFDGPYINMADQGFASAPGAHSNIYFPTNITDSSSEAATVSFSPNRQVASPVLFGSLPSGITPLASVVSSGSQQPWRTLLFCPNPAAGNAHPGFGTSRTSISGTGPDSRAPFSIAPDHLFLDYFWMPVVEPYAISETFATSGKININTAIAPFSYIRRDTAIYALLKALKIPAISDNSSGTYKSEHSQLPNHLDASATQNWSWRYNIDIEAVLAGMKSRRLDHNELFRTASEITTIFMVPRRQTNSTGSAPGPTHTSPLRRYDETAEWWQDGRKLSGDNLREAPYDAIYSRITTKSNTYTVYYRVQALKQVPAGRVSNADWQRWNESTDQILSEYRGSATIERYIDSSQAIPDFALPANSNKNLAPYYRWRTISQRQFVP